ncbi:MAG: peptide chain release factor N(5)-glutamine methyltransferase [Usitatibacter sp.]
MLTVKATLEELMASMDRIDAQVIMSHVLGVNRAWIAANPMRILTESEDAQIETLAAQRAMGRPVAYLLGRREFYGYEFAVGPDVLIPRPETETLVQAALARLAPRDTCLDLGTGSGAVAVTIARQRPEARVVATDASAEALALAQRNAQTHECADRIEFLQGSWYEPVGPRRFDVIVANPPYVAAGDPHLSRGDLRFEPRHALTDGSADGLGSIRAIVSGASEHLKPRGWLLLEHGYDQAAAVAGLLEASGFRDLVSVPDLAGIPRVAGGKI